MAAKVTTLYKSCKECKQKCCMTGPGPHKVLTPKKYLENFGTTDSYNTKCESLTKAGNCKLWKTPKFPTACRTHICTSREFSKQEIDTINLIFDTTDTHGCPKCKGGYVIYHNKMLTECEICGFKWRWRRIPVAKE